MATNHTTNYNLNLWEPTDSFVREEFNENTTKLDAALAGKGNCSVYISLYSGKGKYGSQFPTIINLPRNPTAVVVIGGGALLIAHFGRAETSQVGVSGSGNCEASWGSNSPAMYLESSNSPAHQMNAQGNLYSVIAFYCES